MVLCNQTAKTRTDTSASTCYHDLFALDKGIDLLHIDFDRITSQKILHCYVFQRTDTHLTGQELIDTRQVLQLTPGLFTDVQDIPLLLRCRTRNCHNDLLDLELFDTGENIISSPDHRNSFDISAPFIRVIINNTTYDILQLFGCLDITQDHLTCLARTDQKYLLRLRDLLCLSLPASLKQYKPVRKTHSQRQHKLNHNSEYIIRKWHLPEKYIHSHTVDHKCNSGCHNRPKQLAVACKSPDAIIETHLPEHKD